jgi:hypothetical protein
MGFQEDYIRDEMLMHERVRAHWQAIGSVERFRRKKLMNEAQRLMESLARRTLVFKPIDPVQYERSKQAWDASLERLQRRNVAYYGE